MQGTLVVASDANLGSGSTIELGGTLQAAASFSSAKAFADSAGTIDTAGFNVEFSGAIDGSIYKTGPGTLTLTTRRGLTARLIEGVLALAHATSGNATLIRRHFASGWFVVAT